MILCFFVPFGVQNNALLASFGLFRRQLLDEVRNLARRLILFSQGKSGESEPKKDHRPHHNPDHPLLPRSIDVVLLHERPEIDERKHCKSKIENRAERMSLKRLDKATMNGCCPRGRQPASRAGFVEEKDTGAGGKSELLVGSVAMRIRVEIDSKSRDRCPDKDDDQLTAQNLLIIAGPKERHGTLQGE